MKMPRRLELAVLAAISLSAGLSHAQSDWKLELFSDAQMSSCAVNYNGPGLFQIHIFHTGTGQALGSAFALYPPECLTGAFWAGDRLNTDFAILQNTQDPRGVGFSYLACVSLPVYLGYVQFFATSPGETCCEYRVSDPTEEALDLIGITCDPIGTPIASGQVIVNPTPNCPCETPLATESVTWGGVKALYR